MREGIAISVPQQQLVVQRNGQTRLTLPVSTAAAGTDEREGSGGTPRGSHRIRAMIGANARPGTVFVGRRPTGERYSEALGRAHPQRDWILTRIIWLCGEEPGRNRGGNVDTQRRLIYIHGTPDSEPMGVPRSHGCIRLHSPALVTLFDLCYPGMPVWIGAQ